jgi:DNA-binding transcriptional MerR regulator
VAEEKITGADTFDVSELSRRSRVPVATIKFYLREGILPSGDLSRPSRAYYDESHLTRLRLIGILRDVGKLPVKRIRDVVRVIDRSPSVSLESLGEAMAALARGGLGKETAAVKRAKNEVRALLERESLNVALDSPMVNELAHALAGVRRVTATAEMDVPIGALDQYVKPMNVVASLDFRSMVTFMANGDMGHSETLGYAVVGTLAWEPVLLALRKVLHEHHARTLLGATK